MAHVNREELERRLVVDGPHALSSADAAAALDTSERGLTSEEARARLARYGRNELPRADPPGVVRIFLRQFANPLIYILLAAAAIAAATRDWSDAGFIVVVLLLNAVIGCVQEYGAEQSAQALRALSVSKAYVLRDGADHELDAAELVPGDVVLLETGSRVPADVRLLSDGVIEADESLLTGESLTVTKAPGAVLSADTGLGDRINMAFAATFVTRGRAHAIVVATGLATQFGRIASSLAVSEVAKPPLLVRMERFTRKIALGVAGAVVALGAATVAQGSSVMAVFTLAVALAASAIPEGLPVALTVALSIGARRMAARKVIARRLVAVEALGSVRLSRASVLDPARALRRGDRRRSQRRTRAPRGAHWRGDGGARHGCRARERRPDPDQRRLRVDRRGHRGGADRLRERAEGHLSAGLERGCGGAPVRAHDRRRPAAPALARATLVAEPRDERDPGRGAGLRARGRRRAGPAAALSPRTHLRSRHARAQRAIRVGHRRGRLLRLPLDARPRLARIPGAERAAPAPRLVRERPGR